MNCEKLKDFLNANDLFCRHCGITLTRVAPGEAEAELEITPQMMNSRNVVQGGAIMTLADFAFAGAGNSMGCTVVSTGVNVSFVRPGTGKFLRATCQKLHHGKTISLYRAEIFNDQGDLVAEATINGFNIADTCIYLDKK